VGHRLVGKDMVGMGEGEPDIRASRQQGDEFESGIHGWNVGMRGDGMCHPSSVC